MQTQSFDQSFDQLRQVAALHPLSEQGLQEVARLGQVLIFPRGCDLLSEPQLDNATFYLIVGQLRIASKRNGAELMVGGTTYSAALQKGPDLLLAEAVTSVTLLCIETDLLDVTLILDQLLPHGTVPRPARGARPDGHVADHLQSGALSALTPDRIALLLERFEPVNVLRGQVILREGEPGDYYYVVDEGHCVVTRKIGNTQTQLAELRPGDGFGEEALLADAARNATVTMKSDGRLYRLSGADFNTLLRQPLLRQLPPKEALEKRDSAIWIDVRFPTEYNRDKLPWAINIPLSEIRHIFSVLDRSGEYVVYCQNGRRSRAAAFLLAQSGFKSYALEGGLEALASEAALAAEGMRLA